MDNSTNPRLLVAIVNYRTAELALDCLRALAGEAAALPGLRAIVVDNASGDDSVERIHAAVSEYDWTKFLPLADNRGFSAGNNAAIRPALAAAEPPDYVLLLNPDTVVRPGAIAELLTFMESNSHVGLAGARLEDPDGTPQRSAFRFPTVLGELENGMRLGALTRLLSRYVVAPPVCDKPGKTDWLCGACLMVRREVFDAVGLLDEGYFLYYEEVDFCRRAARAGWPCWYVPEARVVHRVGASTGWTTNRRRPRYWFDSRRRYFRRHLGAAKTLLADALWATGYATFRLRRPLQGKPDTDPAHLLGDFVCSSFLPRAAEPRAGRIGRIGLTGRIHAAGAALPIAEPGTGALGVVAIGRNEGERLRTCLSAIAGVPIVYVDSGSTDGSVDLARAMGADMVALDLSAPFTAARARNAGLHRLLDKHADVEFVQFVDGDCELTPDWLAVAVAALRARPQAAAVFGRLRERRPEASVYNRMCDVEWAAAPLGEVDACGGIALMRTAAVRQVGGFDPAVLAAEDDELCLRLRRAGWTVVRIAADMGWHDAAMTRFGQWWVRAVRSGWAYAQGAALHGRSEDRHFVHERRRAILWAGVLPALIVLLAWPTGGWSLLGLLLYALSAVRYYRFVRSRDVPPRTAFEYTVAGTLSKFPHLVGIVRYAMHRGPVRLIEYK
jgi:N-acetylglucosaminyl-diphospho-decaprenol L-rhamnosyltransferase